HIIDASLKAANVLKLNDEELPALARIYDLSGTDDAIMQALSDRFELTGVALTRGAGGAVLLRGGELARSDGRSVEVVDTVGAGDAFTAALAFGWLQHWDLLRIVRTATRIAAYVCTQGGATPSIPPDWQQWDD
ncbi:MAG: carbohydrate kinase, partial [Pirellulaceae bacterium]|nr:carbohydrate kinase [Pirellulaceae bacterium]